MDDEIKIDLRPIIRIMIRRWRLIVGVPLAFAFFTLVVSLLTPPVYAAVVFVAVSRQKVEVQFETQIQTVTEDQVAQSQVDRAARLETFRELVVNPAIGEEVLPQFADRLSELDKDLLDTPRFLASHVSVDQNTKSDLIGIVIKLPDPVLAADIANAWAQAYEEHINKLYTSSTPAGAKAVSAQAEQSRQVYTAMQSELETYLAGNPIPRLEKQIEILQIQINSYQTALLEAESLVNSRELETRRQMLGGYYEDLVTLERLLSDARLLKKQIASGEVSSASAFGDSLAMIFMRSRTFVNMAGASDAPLSLQLQTPLTSGPIIGSDIDNLILSLEQRKKETEATIADLTATLLDPQKYEPSQDAGAPIKARVEQWTLEIQSLQAQLEAEMSHRKDLERQRDLAWNTYSQLASKTVEVGVAAESGGTEVRVASQALPPVKDVESTLLTVVVAGMSSFVLTVLSVFVFEWWQKWSSEENYDLVGQTGRKNRGGRQPS